MQYTVQIIILYNKCKESVVAQSCLTLATLWTVAHQAPLSMEFSKQEYWSGLPFPSPGTFRTQGYYIVYLYK